jgi:hypothetical protein
LWTITLVASERLAAIMTTYNDFDFVRRSFLASNWSRKESML